MVSLFQRTGVGRPRAGRRSVFPRLMERH
jgi:hypothetical protein